MRVTISRTDGSIEVMDTDRFTRPEPFPGKAIASDFTLRWLEDRSLVLDVDFYSADGVPEGGLAMRRRGWTALLSSPAEFPTLASVSVDGGLAWIRAGDAVLDVRRLQASSSLWYEGERSSLAGKAVWLHDFLLDAEGGTEESAREAVGLSGRAYDIVAEASSAI